MTLKVRVGFVNFSFETINELAATVKVLMISPVHSTLALVKGKLQWSIRYVLARHPNDGRWEGRAVSM